ncbi:polysaccharide deacetylase family protein [Streptomyces lonarensis]|uniref:Polysaccharide deacetylase family protein n=3 Tax=Streptomyces lonarensis TaxID=700599 RepID=A0A7X6D5H2_9ACTN|nr:polysaccharide deacetylase family protein [Streptomyces lonarensis]
MYHSVDHPTADPYNITVSRRRLEEQLRWLRERGLRGVSLGEMLAAHAAGRSTGLVGLTFDDGYTDFLTGAVPLLHRYDCTATVFVLPGLLGGFNDWDPLGPRKPLLTGHGVRAVAAAGMEVGSHGMYHRSLLGLREADLRAELEESRDRLADICGTPPAGFCYPYGDVDAAAAAMAREVGYDYACSIDPGPLTGRWALPRAHVGQRDTAARLWAKRVLHPLRRRAVTLADEAGARAPRARGAAGAGPYRAGERPLGMPFGVDVPAAPPPPADPPRAAVPQPAAPVPPAAAPDRAAAPGGGKSRGRRGEAAALRPRDPVERSPRAARPAPRPDAAPTPPDGATVRVAGGLGTPTPSAPSRGAAAAEDRAPGDAVREGVAHEGGGV